MIALKIPDQKDFTTKLFLGDTFDAFHVSQASFTTNITYTLDGTLHKDYYTEDEWDELKQTDLVRWSALKPTCFGLIKGSRLPKQFRIVFVLSKSNTEKLLRQSGITLSPEVIQGLVLNVRYEQGTISLVTAVSFATFVMDKTVGAAWDEMVRKYLVSCKIPFEEM